MSTTPTIYRALTKGDYTIEVIQGTTMPRVAVVLVTAVGEVRAQLFAIAGFDTASVLERAELWLAQFTGAEYSVKRIQTELRFEDEASRRPTRSNDAIASSCWWRRRHFPASLPTEAIGS
jgi:hypothetical protein